MKWSTLIFLTVISFTITVKAAVRKARQSPYNRPIAVQGKFPQGFRPSTQYDEDFEDEIDRNTVTPTAAFRPQNQYKSQERSRIQERRQQNRQQNLKDEEEEEEEKEEPDRLSLLLPQSKFNCGGKVTGYYADEGLNCEVFHYCQDNARHSWICPEGFLFHQVHLICMPPSSDNICTQSSQYHFVNDYLYKPINIEEVQRKPNVSLRYSERYYPEIIYNEETVRPTPGTIQIQSTTRRPLPSPIPSRHHIPHAAITLNPNNQVFHSPEEVNIPLQHRRPIQQIPHRNIFHSNEEYEY